MSNGIKVDPETRQREIQRISQKLNVPEATAAFYLDESFARGFDEAPEPVPEPEPIEIPEIEPPKIEAPEPVEVPKAPRITSGYGEMTELRKFPHQGIDIAMPEGTPVRALSGGTVTQVVREEDGDGGGLRIFVRGDDGIETRYMHASSFPAGIDVGVKVEEGQTIMMSGSTGRSTGPHLHLETGKIDDDGKYVRMNPAKVYPMFRAGQPPETPKETPEHLKRDFKLEIPTLLTGLQVARGKMLSGRGDESSIPEEIEFHANSLGLDVKQLREAAKTQGISLQYMIEEVARKGRPASEVVQEAKDRGVFALMDPEQRASYKEDYALDTKKAVEEFRKTGDHTFLLDAFGNDAYDPKEAMPFFGGQAAEFAEVAKPDEAMFQVAGIIAEAVSKDKEASGMINAFKEHYHGAHKYAQKRAQQYLKQNEITVGDENYEEMERKFFRRAIREVVALKTVGMWTGPIIMPEEQLLESFADRDLSDRFFDALKPTVEVVGMRDVGGKAELVVREENPLLYFFNLIDMAASAGVGALTAEGDVLEGAVEGMEQRRNAFEAAIDSEFAEKNAVNKTVAFIGGGLATILTPDLLVGAGAAAKITKMATNAVTTQRAAKRAGQLLADISVARGAENYAKAEELEALLRSEFPQEGGVADLLDVLDAESAQFLVKTNEEMLDTTFIQKLGLIDQATGGQTDFSRRALALHPSVRKPRLSAGRGRQGVQGIGYANLYGYEGMLDEFESARNIILQSGLKGKLPALESQVQGNIKLLENLVESATDEEGARFIARLKESLADAIEDPKEWNRRFHGDGNLESELAQITALRGPTDEQIASATGEALEKLKRERILANGRREKIHAELGKITSKADNIEDPIAILDRAIETVKANNESRGLAAKMLSTQVLGSKKLRPITGNPRAALSDDAIELSSEANVLANKLEAGYNITEEQSRGLAAIMDARSRAWAASTGKPASQYFNRNISRVIKGDDVAKPKFEMNEVEDGLVELTTDKIKEAEGFGLMFRVQDDAVAVRTVELPEQLRGQGLGSALYGRALQHAKSLNKGFVSDVAPSPEAIRVYETLMERGVPLRRRLVDLPDGSTGRQYFIEADELTKVDLKGLELVGTKPAVDVAADGRAVLNAFTQPTFRGAVKGMAYVFRRDLDEFDNRVIEEWCGVTNSNWTEAAETKWAAGFEQYLAEGEVPNPQVKTVFDKFKIWVSESYRNIIGTPTDAAIPNEVRQVFDKLLSEQPPTKPPFERALRALSVGDGSRIIESKVDPVMELAQAARSQGMRNSEPMSMLSSLETNGQIKFRSPVEINGIRKQTWTEQDLAELQLRIESQTRIAKQAEEAPDIPFSNVPGAEAAETIDEKVIAAVGGEGVLRAVSRMAVYSVLGGDHVGVVLRRLRPEHRHSVLAASRTTEQAIGDCVTLISETGSKGGVQRLHAFLGGQLSKFQSGRDAFSSGRDFVGLSLATVERSLLSLENIATATKKANGEQKNLLDFLGDMADEMDKAASPEAGFEAFMGVKSNKQAMAKIMDTLVNDENQLIQDLFLAFGAKGKKRPSEAVVLKTLMEATGLHAGRLRDLDGAERAAEIMKKLETQYGAEKSLRAAVIFTGHGQAAEARNIWSGLGLAIDEDMMKAWESWLMGERIDPDMIPKMHDMVRNYGLRPEFIDDAVLEAGFYIPRAARDKLTKALTKAGVLENPEQMTDISDAGLALRSVYTYLKTRMTRGGFLIRQRYFLMNTIDHFGQMAMVAGFRPALVSTVRLSFQNFMVLPGIAQTLGLVDKIGGAQAAERLRRGLQVGGDKAAEVVGKMLNVSKYRVEVNPILEGVAKDGSTTFRLTDPDTGTARFYNYDDIRKIAVEEGIFASFDTRELERAIKTGVRVEAKQFLDDMGKAGSPLFAAKERVRNTAGFFTDNVAKTAEAWSERERLGAMVTLMEIGMEPRQAARLVIDGLFDYAGSMSKLDRSALVSLVFPFWAFQKNANRLILRQLATPEGAYRMGVLRRSYTVSADAITELLYERVADPYGLDVDRMPPELQDRYYFLRSAIENGYGPLDELKKVPNGAVILEEIEASYGPIESIDAETRKILEQGYGGYSKTPVEIRDAVRLYLAGTITGYADDIDSEGNAGQLVTLTGRLRTRLHHLQPRTPEGETFADFYNAKPDPSARRNFHRDRVGFGIKPRMTQDMRKFLATVKNDPVVGFNDVYLDVLYPDSTIYAGFRHALAMTAIPILMARGLFVEEDSVVSERMRRTDLDMMGDPFDSPVPSVIASGLTEIESRPRRLHPEFARTLRSLKDRGVPLPTITIIPAVEDPFAEEGEEIVEKERAYMAGGTGAMLFSLTPFGELNDLMARLEKAPVQERMEIEGEILKWAEFAIGLQVVETSRQVSARADAPRFKMVTSTPTSPK